MSNEAADLTCLRKADVGTALPSITGSGPVTWPESPGEAANEVVTLTVSGTPTGGTFKLTFGGQESASIPYDAAAGEVEQALENLSSIGEGNVQVTGSAGGPWTVTFIGLLGTQNVGAITLTTNALTGGTTPSVGIVVTTPGSTGGGVWALAPTIDAEKGLAVGFGGTYRRVRDLGSKAPNRVHVLDQAIKSLSFTLTESGLAALRFAFPNFEWDGTKLRLAVKSKEAEYSAWALETPLGVFHIPKGCPMQDTELKYVISDIAQPSITIEAVEHNGEVGWFYPFPDLI